MSLVKYYLFITKMPLTVEDTCTILFHYCGQECPCYERYEVVDQKLLHGIETSLNQRRFALLSRYSMSLLLVGMWILLTALVSCNSDTDKFAAKMMSDSLSLARINLQNCERSLDSLSTTVNAFAARAVLLQDSIDVLQNCLRAQSDSTASQKMASIANSSSKLNKVGEKRRLWNSFLDKIVSKLESVRRFDNKFASCRTSAEFREEETRLNNHSTEGVFEANSYLADLCAKGYDKCDEVAAAIRRFASSYGLSVSEKRSAFEAIVKYGHEPANQNSVYYIQETAAQITVISRLIVR